MQHTTRRVIPILADLVGVGLAFLLLPLLAERFQALAFINSVILGFFFLLFCLAVYGLKKLAPVERGTLALRRSLLAQRPLGVLGVIFALIFTVAVAYSVGFLDSVVGVNRFLLDEPSVTLYLLLTPASWFGLSLIYMLLLSGETEQTVQPGEGRYPLLSLAGLSGVNLMAVGLTAVSQSLWARYPGVGNSYLVFTLTFLLYLLLFGPPRLLYQTKQPRPWWLGLTTFVPLLLYLAWLATT